MSNTIIHPFRRINDQGEYHQTIWTEAGIQLDKDVTSGEYESSILPMNPFTRLIASWNGETSTERTIEVFFRVLINQEWSDYFTYGKWGLGRENQSVPNQVDTKACLSIDTLICVEEATAVQYKVRLERVNLDCESPVLRLIAFSTNGPSKPLIPSLMTKQSTVPPLSQMEVPEIGSHICGPTSVTMMMNRLGQKLLPQEVAKLARDYGANIFGNWSYNVAVAGALGYRSYVQWVDSIDGLKALVESHDAVVASITVTDANQLDNLPNKKDSTEKMTYPHGHLLVVTGFGVENGEPVIYVNDPAAPEKTEVSRYYKESQFEQVWKNVVYIIDQQE